MRRFVYLVIGSTVLIGVGWIWLTASYLEVKQVRIDEEPVQVFALYSNETSDPLCTKLYASIDGRLSNEPIFPRVAADVPDPNDDLSLKNGDRLILQGFRYEWQQRNMITGHKITRQYGRIDVVGWRGPSGVNHMSRLDPSVPQTFPQENYIGCR